MDFPLYLYLQFVNCLCHNFVPIVEPLPAMENVRSHECNSNIYVWHMRNRNSVLAYRCGVKAIYIVHIFF